VLLHHADSTFANFGEYFGVFFLLFITSFCQEVKPLQNPG